MKCTTKLVRMNHPLVHTPHLKWVQMTWLSSYLLLHISCGYKELFGFYLMHTPEKITWLLGHLNFMVIDVTEDVKTKNGGGGNNWHK